MTEFRWRTYLTSIGRKKIISWKLSQKSNFVDNFGSMINGYNIKVKVRSISFDLITQTKIFIATVCGVLLTCSTAPLRNAYDLRYKLWWRIAELRENNGSFCGHAQPSFKTLTSHISVIIRFKSFRNFIVLFASWSRAPKILYFGIWWQK